jgi:hypothetical protein
MTEDPTIYQPDDPAEPHDNADEVIVLEDQYVKALVGHTISAEGTPRAVYSLTKLVKAERTLKDMAEDPARMSIVSLIFEVTRDHGERAPIFVDDAISQPKPVEKGKIIRPGGW